jgi:predicted dehydrogenase
MTSRANLRLGIIGCGEIAGYMARLARLTPGLRLAACCDRTLGVAERFARRMGIPRAFEDYETLLRDPDMDAVYIAAPHHLHYPMLRAAVQAGKHVLCEKPVTRTLAEGQAIARLAEAAGVRVGVNYQYRYDPAAYALARASQEGALGRLLYARCNLPWRRTAAYFSGGAWRASVATAGGGTLMTQGSHLLDLALWAMGSPPHYAVGMTARRVFADVQVEDLAQGVLELADGAQVAITSAMIASVEFRVQVEVYGEQATGIYTGGWWPSVRFVGRRVRGERPPTAGLHPLHASLRAFTAWALGRGDYLIPVREALPVLAAVEALYRSATGGARVEVAAVDESQEIKGS